MVNVSFLKSGIVLTELRNYFREADSAQVAVAFLSKDGFDELRDVLTAFLNEGKNTPEPFWERIE